MNVFQLITAARHTWYDSRAQKLITLLFTIFIALNVVLSIFVIVGTNDTFTTAPFINASPSLVRFLRTATTIIPMILLAFWLPLVTWQEVIHKRFALFSGFIARVVRASAGAILLYTALGFPLCIFFTSLKTLILPIALKVFLVLGAVSVQFLLGNYVGWCMLLAAHKDKYTTADFFGFVRYSWGRMFLTVILLAIALILAIFAIGLISGLIFKSPPLMLLGINALNVLFVQTTFLIYNMLYEEYKALYLA